MALLPVAVDVPEIQVQGLVVVEVQLFFLNIGIVRYFAFRLDWHYPNLRNLQFSELPCHELLLQVLTTVGSVGFGFRV